MEHMSPETSLLFQLMREVVDLTETGATLRDREAASTKAQVFYELVLPEDDDLARVSQKLCDLLEPTHLDPFTMEMRRYNAHFIAKSLSWQVRFGSKNEVPVPTQRVSSENWALWAD